MCRQGRASSEDGSEASGEHTVIFLAHDGNMIMIMTIMRIMTMMLMMRMVEMMAKVNSRVTGKQSVYRFLFFYQNIFWGQNVARAQIISDQFLRFGIFENSKTVHTRATFCRLL